MFHGSNGFMDGTYLIPHPREWKDWKSTNPKTPTNRLKLRRQLAQYANIAATILDAKVSALFRVKPTRTVNGKKQGETDHPIEQWWQDVDGWGCSIDDWMSDGFICAGVYGHTIHYMDRDPMPQNGYDTAADAPRPYLRAYTPLDMPDWRQDGRGRLLEVALLEGSDNRQSIKQTYTDLGYTVRYVNETGWETYTATTQQVAQQATDKGDHGFGVLPIVVQYATRKRMEPLIGESVLGDPNSYIDIYNIDSEIRELLRGQTFGILAVKIGTGDAMVDIEKVKALMGDEKGVDNVLFTPDGAEYIQPDASNVTVYQEERRQRVREIFRKAAVSFENDSKDAEAEGSIKLKREDMNQTLAKYADECEKAEIAIAKLWFRAQYGESWESEWESAEVSIQYPDNFDITPFADILEQAQAAITLEMPPTFMKELKTRLVPKFMPDAPQAVLDDIEKELEKQATDAAKMQDTSHRATLKSMVSGENPDAPFGQNRPAA